MAHTLGLKVNYLKSERNRIIIMMKKEDMLDYQSTCPNVLCYESGLMLDGYECSCCAGSSGEQKPVLVVWLCCDMLLFYVFGSRARRFPPRWKHAGLLQLIKPAQYF